MSYRAKSSTIVTIYFHLVIRHFLSSSASIIIVAVMRAEDLILALHRLYNDVASRRVRVQERYCKRSFFNQILINSIVKLNFSVKSNLINSLVKS
jgi:hypothetical protein